MLGDLVSLRGPFACLCLSFCVPYLIFRLHSNSFLLISPLSVAFASSTTFPDTDLLLVAPGVSSTPSRAEAVEVRQYTLEDQIALCEQTCFKLQKVTVEMVLNVVSDVHVWARLRLENLLLERVGTHLYLFRRVLVGVAWNLRP